MKKEWHRYPDGHKNEKGYDGEYRYVYENTETFKRLKNNLRKNVSPKFIAPSSKPKARVIINVIDRHDNWCKENKHTKVLTSKLSFWKNDEYDNPIYFPEMGVPEIVYSRIMDEIVAYRGHWNLDAVIRKNSNDVNNAYTIKDILDDKIKPESKKIGSSDPLTEEELAYELYNFDTSKTFSVTPYNVLYKKLIGLFKMADAEFGTNFTEELEKKVEEELEKKVEEELDEKEEEEENNNNILKEKNTVEKFEKKSVEIPSSREEKSVRRSQASETISYESIFPHWNSLNEEEKKEMIKNIKGIKVGTKSVPEYVNVQDVLPCIDKNCKFVESNERTVFPSTVFTCPVCGKVDKSN